MYINICTSMYCTPISHGGRKIYFFQGKTWYCTIEVIQNFSYSSQKIVLSSTQIIDGIIVMIVVMLNAYTT